jgi:hypothetical protein
MLSVVHTGKLGVARPDASFRALRAWQGNWKIGPMKASLSRNEMEILDRHVATLTHQLSEIAGLLESRLGETNELAASARNAQREFARFAHRIRRQTAVVSGDQPLQNKSQTA